jgi:hypothetical protein
MRSVRKGALGVAVAAVTGAVSCSAKNLPPPGELMVVVTTDASPPKDIDTLHVQVKSNGVPLLDFEYPLGPGGLLVPATLGLVAGRDPSTPALIRVYARKAGKVRVLREATVTVPTDRLAMLRMPINWLCYDDAADIFDDATDRPIDVMNTKCAPNQTCAGGQCMDSTLDDPTKLLAFEPKSVFGGGTGHGDGTCFDTLGCFASPTVAAVDPTTCTIVKPLDGVGVNVAMIVATHAGSCEPAGAPCFIALEAEDPEGWQTRADDPSRIQLPQEVCARLTSGKLAGVVTTTLCATKQVSTPPCGPGSSVGSVPGDAAAE